jgi:hypothetical protein
MPRVLAALLLCLLGFSSQSFARTRLMGPAADQSPGPEAGKALVVFMRPRFFGGSGDKGPPVTVYDAPDGATTFLGAIEYKHKLAVQMAPGAHRLMVAGAESVDFLDATLDAGKTYYVALKARPGTWTLRFTPIPVHTDPAAKYSVQGTTFREWNQGAMFLEKTPAADAWYADIQDEIAAMKAKWLPAWLAKPGDDPATRRLEAGDGVEPKSR